MHYRQAIRQAFSTALMGATSALDKVHLSRAYPVQSKKCPAILIYTSEETAERNTIGTPGTSLRELSVTIEIYVKRESAPDILIDNIAEQVEIAIANDVSLNDMVKCIEYQGIEIEEIGEGDNQFFVATMTYSVIYRVNNNDPSTNV